MITPRTATLHITMGLPRSGKSTWAKGTGHPIVNRDAIRLALHGEAYKHPAEPMVTALEEYMARSLLLAGHEDVVIDATHLHRSYTQKWMRFRCPGVHAIHVIPKMFPTSASECICRALNDKRDDLVPVIENMWEKYGANNPWIERD